MPSENQGMTYQGTGVDYGAMDPFKLACQQRAALTVKNIDRLKLKLIEFKTPEALAVANCIQPIEATRGESVYLLRVGNTVIGIVEEGLGTKNLVADAMFPITGKTYYDANAQDTVAMIVNDQLTLGILPIALSMHLAVGSSKWFANKQRVADLVNGWGAACDMAGCVWAGGETPTLRDIILPEAALLSGSAVGVPSMWGRIFDPATIRSGDQIFILESSGIGANGLTLSRDLATKLPEGYATLMPDGRMYGEALLDPTHIYREFIEECLNHDMVVHYAVNITGHGWRKFMRAPLPFAYIMDGEMPQQLPIFDFIQKHGQVTDEEMYGTFNMGAGFAVFIPRDNVAKFKWFCHKTNGRFPFRIIHGGHIEESPKKKVVIPSKNLEFSEETLAVR